MSEHEIKIADWQTDKEKLRQVRRLVFIEEQNVPELLEWDEFDTTSIHFLVLQNNQAIACARLKPDGQIGRMAVLAEHRKHGLGSELLQFVLQTARTQDFKKIYLHAQLTAIPFYEKHSFTTYGNIFFEADIPHREMSRKIC